MKSGFLAMAHFTLFPQLAQPLFQLLDLPVQADVGLYRTLQPELGRSGLRLGRFDPPVSFALTLRDLLQGGLRFLFPGLSLPQAGLSGRFALGDALALLSHAGFRYHPAQGAGKGEYRRALGGQYRPGRPGEKDFPAVRSAGAMPSRNLLISRASIKRGSTTCLRVSGHPFSPSASGESVSMTLVTWKRWSRRAASDGTESLIVALENSGFNRAGEVKMVNANRKGGSHGTRGCRSRYNRLPGLGRAAHG